MNNANRTAKNLLHFFIFLPMLLLALPTLAAHAQEQGSEKPPPEINWVAGPGTVDLGSNLAQIDLREDYVFADAEGSRKLMDLLGNPPSNNEIGLVASRGENQNWFVLFEYDPSGYVRDDEKDSLDPDAILESIKKSTEGQNKIRQQKGVPPVTVLGWYEKPHYDSLSHNLVWAVLGEEEGIEVVNYNVKLLGRYGYTAAVLVTDPAGLDLFKPELENIIASFSYKRGKRYAEFTQGDKVAEYGLTALVVGGATAAAVKFGLFKWLAKAWKLVAVAIAAFAAAVWRITKRLLGRKEQISHPQ